MGRPAASWRHGASTILRPGRIHRSKTRPNRKRAGRLNCSMALHLAHSFNTKPINLNTRDICFGQVTKGGADYAPEAAMLGAREQFAATRLQSIAGIGKKLVRRATTVRKCGNSLGKDRDLPMIAVADVLCGSNLGRQCVKLPPSEIPFRSSARLVSIRAMALSMSLRSQDPSASAMNFLGRVWSTKRLWACATGTRAAAALLLPASARMR